VPPVTPPPALPIQFTDGEPYAGPSTPARRLRDSIATRAPTDRTFRCRGHRRPAATALVLVQLDAEAAPRPLRSLSGTRRVVSHLAGDHLCDQAGLPRPRHLRAGAGGPARAPLPLLQVPLHDRRRGPHEEGPAPSERGRRPGLQAADRSA